MATPDSGWVLVTNAGSDDLSLFAATPEGLRLSHRVASAGRAPLSVTVHGDLVYVLNTASSTVHGFRHAEAR